MTRYGFPVGVVYSSLDRPRGNQDSKPNGHQRCDSRYRFADEIVQKMESKVIRESGHPRLRLWSPVSFTYVLRPVPSGTRDLGEIARRGLPVLSNE